MFGSVMKILGRLVSPKRNKRNKQRAVPRHCFLPGLEQLEDRVVPTARTLVWHPSPMNFDLSNQNNWDLNTYNSGSHPSSGPAFEDTIKFTVGANATATLDTNITVNAFDMNCTMTLTMGAHTLTVRKNDANGYFTLAMGAINMNSANSLFALREETNATWSGTSGFTGGLGHFVVYDDADLTISGTTNQTKSCQTSFDIGQTTYDPAYVHITAAAGCSLALGDVGSVAINGPGTLRVENPANATFTVSATGSNSSGTQVFGKLEVLTATGTLNYQAMIVVEGGGTMTVKGKLVANPTYASATAAVVQSSGSLVQLYRGGTIQVVWDPYNQFGGEFRVMDSNVSDTVTTTGVFNFESVVYAGYDVPDNHAVIWRHTGGGALNFSTDSTLYMRMNGSGAGEDYIIADGDLNLEGTLRMKVYNEYSQGVGPHSFRAAGTLFYSWTDVFKGWTGFVNLGSTYETIPDVEEAGTYNGYNYLQFAKL